jgi:hypothetical protein
VPALILKPELIMSTKLMLCSALILAASVAGAAPENNINPNKHPNLAAAQRLVTDAYGKVSAAQSANEWDMGGHAAHAKDLLDQANRELKAAAVAANENHR